MSGGDVSKLPRWAQRKIESLERDVDYLSRLLNDGPDDTDTTVEDFVTRTSRKLEDQALIAFHLPNGAVHAHIVERGEGRPLLELSAPSGELLIRPRSSNVIAVEAAR